ncbi:MAG: hypothetical protein WCV55_02820 [Candidatus Paceibacterota bacterium]
MKTHHKASCTSCGWRKDITAPDKELATKKAFELHAETQLRGAIAPCSDEAVRITVVLQK